MKTKEQLKELQERLKVIEAWESVQIKFGSKQFSQPLKENITKEIEEYKRKRIEDIDKNIQPIDNSFSDNELKVLKKLAKKVLEKPINVLPAQVPVNLAPQAEPPKTGLISKIIEDNAKKKKVKYKGEDAYLINEKKRKALIAFKNGKRLLVENKDLEIDDRGK